MAYDIGPRIGIQGEKEFNNQIKSINNSLKEYGSEMKALTAKFADNEKSQEALTEKGKVLAKQYEEQKKKSELLKNQYEKEVAKLKELGDAQKKATEENGKASAEAAKAESAFNKQAEQVSKLKVAMNETDGYMGTLTKSIKENQEEVEKLGNKYQQASEKMKTISDNAEAFGKKMSAAGKAMTPVSLAATGAGVAIGKMAIDFESAFTGVTKTVDGTDEQLETIRQGILDMAKTTASSATDIAAVAEAAGQLGVGTDDILDFTKTMVMLGDTTNLSAEEAASALAKFANITQMSSDNYDNLGSVIVDLGNNFATTEADIVNMSTKLAATGELAGFTEPQIMAIATAMSSVGIEAEAGGSAFSKLTKQVQLSVETGNSDLQSFASVAGMTADEFKVAFEQDAVGAIGKFISGLNDTERNGKSAVAILDEMGLTDVRLSNTILSLAGSGDLLTETIDTANAAWGNNNALQDEADKKYQTTEAKLSQLKETFRELAVKLGETLLPIIQDVTDVIKDVVERFSGMSDGSKKVVLAILGILMVVAPLLSGIGKISMGISAVSGLFSTITGGAAAAAAGTAAAGTAAAGGAVGFGAMATSILPIIGIIAIVIGAIVGVIAIIKNWGAIMDWAKNTFGPIIDSIKGFFTGLGDKIGEIKDAIGTKITDMCKGAADKFDEMKAKAGEKIGQMKDNAVEKFNSMKDAAAEKAQNMKDKITAGINGAKEFLSKTKLALSEIKIPKVKLPHFSITGKFSISPPSTPKLNVDWYKEGGILSGAQIFGTMGGKALGGGEAGKEAVLPLSSFYSNLKSIITNMTKPDVPDYSGALEVTVVNNVDVYVGNKEFKNYIVKTSKAGIEKEQIDFRKSRGLPSAT